MNEPLRIIPVLDLLKGQVVRGVAGRRAHYRPIISKLTDSAAPLDVANAIRETFGLNRFYLADLDAIGGSPPALETYQLLQSHGFHLWVDAGLRHGRQAGSIVEAGVEGIIAGLETLSGPEELDQLCHLVGVERLIFSLDLKEGKPLTHSLAWKSNDALQVAGLAVDMGVRRMIVLDLARVGLASGTDTEGLCLCLLGMFPHLELITGGGVRNVSDIKRLQACGVRGVLLASALHDGRLTPKDLAEFGNAFRGT
jgi:phosphoribosylformimino-5-aminoimidazole carboxamide ribotide isomerase